MTANGHTRLVLFDIDGTLLLTAGAGRRAIVAALRDEVEDPAAFADIRFDGKTDPQIVVEMLEAAGQEESRESDRVRMLCRRYVELLALELERPTTRTTLMPGVLPLLDELEQRTEAVLGLLTGNVAEGAALKLRSGGLDPSRFRVGAYGSDAGHRPALPRSPRVAPRRSSAGFRAVPKSSSSATRRRTSIAARASAPGRSASPPGPTPWTTCRRAALTRCSRTSPTRSACSRPSSGDGRPPPRTRAQGRGARCRRAPPPTRRRGCRDQIHRPDDRCAIRPAGS